jgi:excisionase family DNA binding protein
MALEMLSPKDLSKLTAIPVRTITRLAQEGKIPAVKVGRQWRFIREDVERWLKGAASNARHRILIVDDDEAIVQLVRAILSSMGHSVTTATRGQDGLDILRKDTDFSLLVLDLQMPDVSGVDVLEWMRDHHVQIATLIFTAHFESELMEKAARYSHLTVLKKPAHPDDIRRAVASTLDGVRQSIPA